MKNKFTTSLIAAVAMVIAAPSAEAQRHRHHHGQQNQMIFVSGYHPCGTPIYSERFVVRYDRFNRPVYRVRPVRHRPGFVRPAPRGYYAPHGYYAPQSVCPPPHRGGAAIRIRF